MRGRVVMTLAVAALSVAFLWFRYQDYARTRRWRNVDRARARLIGLVAAEAMFRSGDLNQNGVPDYWTGDVAGLLQFGLIDPSLAMADPRPLVPMASKPVPKDGYYFMALEIDDSASPSEPYRQDTDGVNGKVHHRSRFGFIAIPAVPAPGMKTIIINEGAYPYWNYEWKGSLRWPSENNLRIEWINCWGG